MRPIFETKGRAREFSPLAMDIWNGCDHGCIYCFNRRRKDGFGELTRPRPSVVENLRQQIAKEGAPKRQVLLTFSGDPYCLAVMWKGVTRACLEILCENDVPVAILTKGGARCLRDVDLFARFKHIKIGATVVFDDESYRERWEPSAAPTAERIEALEQLKAIGLRTWVSLEPVVRPDQTLRLIHRLADVSDGFKISKLNYHEYADGVDWGWFVVAATEALRATGKPFYVKDDLADFAPSGFEFLPGERDMDAMAIGEK